ncbi:MAG: Fe-S cluster assembly protein SufD [Bacteroidota bacterium]
MEIAQDISLLDLNDHALKPFEEIRQSSLQKLENLSFPSTKVENWKYSRTGKIVKHNWLNDHGYKEIDAAFFIPNWKGSVLKFSNGKLLDSSLIKSMVIDGFKLKPLSKACENCIQYVNKVFGNYSRESENIFDQINNTSWQDGLFLHVPKNVQLKEPVHVVMAIDNPNTAVHMRNVIVLEEGAEAEIVISIVGTGSGKTYQNVITEARLGKNAKLHIDKIQQAGSEEFQMCTEAIYQEQDSHFTINTISVDAGWVRNDLKINIEGINCESNLNGVYLPIEKQHIDNHTVVDHLKPHCNSNEMYKGVIYDQATGVFNGKVFVREDAQKTNAFQSNNNIVMSENASMNSKPELEIYADDVKCSHGSTTGQFDEEAVFYLRARGISELNARKLLVNAFLSDALVNIHNEEVKEYVEGLLEKKQSEILS